MFLKTGCRFPLRKTVHLPAALGVWMQDPLCFQPEQLQCLDFLAAGALLPSLWLFQMNPTVVRKEATKENYSYRAGNVVYNDCCLSSTIIHGGQTVVSFLTSCVPYFKLYSSVVQADSLREKRSSDGAFLVVKKLAFDKTKY